MTALGWLRTWIARLARFAFHVASSFLHNRGILLAGGVAYNALLSVVPFLTLALQALSLFFDRGHILGILRAELRVMVPPTAEAIILQAAADFLDHQATASVVSVALLLFFSSLAFRMLEQAVAAIFHTSSQGAHRHFLVSALLPYLFILVMGVTLFVLTFITSTLDLLTQLPAQFMALDLSVQPLTSALLWVASGLGLVLMFTGIYWVLPVVKISVKRALIGGLCATGLWLVVARFLVYYFANISMVSVIYGSLATTVVLLLFMEVAFIILLLGAQVIAELQAAAVEGKPWWGGSAPAPSPGTALRSGLGRG